MSLQKLIDKIRSNAGYEFHMFATPRNDLTEENILQRGVSEQYSLRSSHNMQKIQHRLTADIHNAEKNKLGAICTYHGSDTGPKAWVAWGQLPIAQEVPTKVKEKKIVMKTTKGFFFNSTRPVLEEVEVDGFKTEISSAPLSKVIQSPSSAIAHYIKIGCAHNGGIEDSEIFTNARVGGNPYVLVIGDQSLTQEIATYLRSNKNMVREFMKGLGDRPEYPQSRKIFSYLIQPTHVSFVDIDNTTGRYYRTDLLDKNLEPIHY